jgi:Zn finger protein HypA/HybF involved in hydrogenase expression
MLPPDNIRKLSDQFGDYVIDVRCRKCAHQREVNPHVLARIFGWNADFKKVAARFRCSKCHGRDIDVQIGFTRRPRRWDAIR